MKLNAILAAGIASLAMLSAPAIATTVDLGALTGGYNAGLDGASVHTPTVFNFTLASKEYLQLGAVVSNTSLQLGNTQLVLKSGNTVVANDYFTKGGVWNASIGGPVFPGLELNAGSYSFTISQVYPSANDSHVAYSMNINSGVPELSAWTMMLAGFGALGFAGYRRRVSAV